MNKSVWYMFLAAAAICAYVGIREMMDNNFNSDPYEDFPDREALAKFLRVRGIFWVITGAGCACLGVSMLWILSQKLFNAGGMLLFVGMGGLLAARRLYLGKSDTKWFF